MEQLLNVCKIYIEVVAVKVVLIFYLNRLLAFLGEFAKLQNATIAFAMPVRLSVCPSFRMEQHGCHWNGFH